VNVPSPAALRFLGTVPPRRVPFGLPAWSDSATDIAVPVPAVSASSVAVSGVAAVLPPPETLAPGTLVVVLVHADRETGFWGRLFGRRTAPDDDGTRASGLLVRGYERIGAARDEASYK
jgi:hypothetical protein